VVVVSVFASFQPRAEGSDDFLDAMGRLVSASRAEPGCLRYDLYRAEPAGYHLFETYADAGAFEAHRATAHYQEYRRTVPELLAEPIGVVVLEPIDVEG
jgi:quinol monooxygenase YgiN